MSIYTRPIPGGIAVLCDGRLIAGIGANWYRPWLHPLYTPAGNPVLQGFPFDHPFHNGCFVGQNPVRAGTRTANFWAAPPQRTPDDELFANVGRVEVTALEFPLLRCVWRDEHGAPMLEEERRFTFEVTPTATVCEVTSRKLAAYEDLEFPVTKFGGICARVDPQLTPIAGARILGRHDAASRFVAYENDRFGLALVGDGRTPWFLRDYGLAALNPTWKEAVLVRKGDAWETRLRLVAYDGKVPGSLVA